MRTAAQHNHVQTARSWLVERAGNLWWALSPERREALSRRRGRLLWKIGLVACLVEPLLLIPMAVAAYATQRTPRRAGYAAFLLIAVALPALWIRNALGDLGLMDADEGTILAATLIGVAIIAGANAVARRSGTASQLRPLLPWIRGALDPVAYGIPRHRVLLGTSGRAWITAPPQVGALVIGPPRSGKTSGVIIPNVLAWMGPCVVTSTRRDVLDACSTVRSQQARCGASIPSAP